MTWSEKPGRATNCGASVSISKRRLLFDFLYLLGNVGGIPRCRFLLSAIRTNGVWRFDYDTFYHDVWRDFCRRRFSHSVDIDLCDISFGCLMIYVIWSLMATFEHESAVVSPQLYSDCGWRRLFTSTPRGRIVRLIMTKAELRQVLQFSKKTAGDGYADERGFRRGSGWWVRCYALAQIKHAGHSRIPVCSTELAEFYTWRCRWTRFATAN